MQKQQILLLIKNLEDAVILDEQTNAKKEEATSSLPQIPEDQQKKANEYLKKATTRLELDKRLKSVQDKFSNVNLDVYNELSSKLQ
jgi:hypothetical protein